jgi:maltooligosyltrehalose trehalohydrolase
MRMSWGATVDGQGGATFRLWAPAQDTVALVRDDDGLMVSMRRHDDGWFDVRTDAVRPGEGYMFRLADGTRVPDPAARAQVGNVHGASRLVDPRAHAWRCEDWRGRPWEEAVIYELHVGTFTPAGTFDGAIAKLEHLAGLGITALEIMPVAQFGGTRGWGYDGVLLYAPHTAYGGPEAFKRFIDAAHARRLMVILDVVYNHFGPDGNYLERYAPAFFHPERTTPWGAAIAYHLAPVRAFFIDNALYWLEEYRLDGLRLDAVNQIRDESPEPLLEELARRIRAAADGRHIHLVTEDDRNIVDLHRRDQRGRVRLFTAEWNDDVHHAMHVIATGETEGYYRDYSNPIAMLARGLAEGFIYQGEPSRFWDGAPRGEKSSQQPPSAFIDFLQNHDQIGNRAFGERLTTLAPAPIIELLTSILLLSPHIPLLFMGEEYGERRPFYFFTDFAGRLAALVREGRRNEFKKWAAFRDRGERNRIPDPNAESTFAASVLDWSLSGPQPQQKLDNVRRLLGVRASEIVPRVADMHGHQASYAMLAEQAFQVSWPTSSGVALVMSANFGDGGARISRQAGADRCIYASAHALASNLRDGELAAKSLYVCWRHGDASQP